MATLAQHEHIALLGLGYVGLPFVLAPSRIESDVDGWNFRACPVAALNAGHDPTAERADGSVQCTCAAFIHQVTDAVGHRRFDLMGSDAARCCVKPGVVLFDIKSIFDKQESDLRL